MRSRARIQLSGKSATGIQLPVKATESLGSDKRPSVHATIHGYTYRSTVAPLGGVLFTLPVSAEVRERAHIAAGDEVDVDLEFDSEPREMSVPRAFAGVLEADPGARRFFEVVSFSIKRRFVLPIEEAMTAEAPQKRIANATSTLRQGKL